MQSFEINGPSVVAETIDGEVVIVNLDSGSYYSIRGIGAIIWGALVDGHGRDKIEEQLNRAQGAGRRVFMLDLGTFVEQLLAEKLLRLSDGGGPVSALTIPPGDYSQPELEKFSDMEALLLLDPIHDVDEKGWPRVT
jgi:coenzyme PQQ synthesis protein D (PqqD)